MTFKLGMTVDMLVSVTLTLMQGHNGLTEDQIQRWIILTTKQAISIKLAARPRVGHDKFYYSPKSSVAFTLTDGHTSISWKTCAVWSGPAFQARFQQRDKRRNGCASLRCDVKNYFCVPLPLGKLLLLRSQDWENKKGQPYERYQSVSATRDSEREKCQQWERVNIWHIILIIIMKTIYIAPKNRMNGTLGASHINSFCIQTHTCMHAHPPTHTHYLSPSPPAPPLALSSLLSPDKRVILYICPCFYNYTRSLIFNK